MKYDSISELVKEAEKAKTSIGRLVLEDQANLEEISQEKIYLNMKKALDVMKESCNGGMKKDLKSVSGLSGGDGYKMQMQVDMGKNICGKVFGQALARALAVSETNACMGKIVAAPTAGSCGIIPAAILTVGEDRNISEKEMVEALFTASAVGIVIANKATISGAEGGCQAECGAASAMAAAALTEMCGGSPKNASNACAIALKNILGLVCDPVAGLVEIPCIKRNAMGVANALTASELALAGIKSAIPADEVIEAMKRVGDAMSSSLKETAEGGLAATPTARKLYNKVFGERNNNG